MRRATWFAIVALVVTAFALRFVWLERRPPHHDEGVNGWFVEGILRDGYYRYDPEHFHGPLHFYLLAAGRALGGFGIGALRVPVALVGALACFLPLLLRRALGGRAALASCAVLACSPTLVYYARDAIHETLFAALTLLVMCCVLCWWSDRRRAWLVGATVAFACMVATKETAIVFAAVAGTWLTVELAVARKTLGWSRKSLGFGLVLVAMFGILHVVLYTSCFRSPDRMATSLRRSVEAYALWQRTGAEPGHAKPWSYYLALGARYELVLYACALAGTIAGWRVRAVRGCAAVGFGLLVAYSAIAYKTPWLPASWLALLAVPAGYGVLACVRFVRERRQVIAIAFAIPALAIAIRSSFVRPADAVEDLAYVHTAADYTQWFALIEDAAHVVGRARMTVGVDHEAEWPLAWALMPFRARWKIAGTEDVMIVSRSHARSLEAKLHEPYYRRHADLRDGTESAFIYFRARRFSPLHDRFAGMTLVEPRAL